MKDIWDGLVELFKGYVIAFILVLIGGYVYMHWMAPWTWLFVFAVFIYLCYAAEHYTNPKNYKNTPDAPREEWEDEAAEFQRREDDWNDNMGYPRDDPDDNWRK